jgi:hypothetical protein
VTHPLAGRLVTARSFKRLNGELLLVIELPDGSPGTIPAGATDVLGVCRGRWPAGGAGRGRVAPPTGEQRLAVGGGNTRAPARRPGGLTGLERRLDGDGDELRGLGVDGDVPAEQYPADDAADVQGRVLRAVGHVKAPC